MQFHWIRIEDVPAIWERLEAVGLSTMTTCGDAPRNILGCPVAGIDASEVLDATPTLRAAEALARGNQAFTNLPRKWKSAISGCASHCTMHEINDVSFVGVTGPDGEPGFDLWVGGGLSTNPMLAHRLGAFVTPERVPEVWAGVTGVFRDYGYRRLRSRARLKFLLADWGPERFREVLESEYLGAPLPDGPAPPPPPDAGSRDHVGVHRQVDGLFYVGTSPLVGRLSGTTLLEVADLAERFGSGRVRTTVEQKLVVLDVPEDRVAGLVAGLAARDLVTQPSPFRRGMLACTGIEFCKLAIVETKARAHGLTAELERRLPGFDTPISINVNGCPNACARIQLADIGLKGVIMRRRGGVPGAPRRPPRARRLVRPQAARAQGRGRGLPDYIERLLRAYQAGRAEGESFATWVHRADDGLLT